MLSGPWFVGGIEHNEILRRVGNSSNDGSWPRALAAAKPLPLDRITVSWHFLNINRSGPAPRVPQSGRRMNPRHKPPDAASAKVRSPPPFDRARAAKPDPTHDTVIQPSEVGPTMRPWSVLRPLVHRVHGFCLKGRTLETRDLPTSGSADRDSTGAKLGVRPIAC
jgi:hypothetical protein